MDAIYRVLAWSFTVLLSGKYPHARHDGEPWAANDKFPATLSGNDLGMRALLVQGRGDWAWLKEIFSFPSWSSSSNICWLCQADRYANDFTEFGLAAAWRQTRRRREEFFGNYACTRSSGEPPCVRALISLSR